MAQNPTQVSTSPPLPGLQLVQTVNGAIETIATDFAGSIDPASTAFAYATWADTGTGDLKRRNAANNAWDIIGRIFPQTTEDASGNVVVAGSLSANSLSSTTGINNTPIGSTTPSTGAFTNFSYTGTLTGGTGEINIGSGQIFKSTSGNVGIGSSSPGASLAISKLTTKLSGTGNSYGLYVYPTSSGECVIDALTGGAGIALLNLRAYSNGNYGSATLLGDGNFQFNSGFGSTATAYGCRAWVNFNGSGGASIRASRNVSSVTRNSTGVYTISFSSAMPDADFSATASLGNNTTSAFSSSCQVDNFGASGVRVSSGSDGGSGSTYTAVDAAIVCVAIFR
jgi:hypothetical protein